MAPPGVKRRSMPVCLLAFPLTVFIPFRPDRPILESTVAHSNGLTPGR